MCEKTMKRGFVGLDVLFSALVLTVIGGLFIHSISVSTNLNMSETKEEVVSQTLSQYTRIENLCRTGGVIVETVEPFSISSVSAAELSYSCSSVDGKLLYVNVGICTLSPVICHNLEGYVSDES